MEWVNWNERIGWLGSVFWFFLYYLFDFLPLSIRLLTGEDFLRVVFFIVPFKFIWLFVERFNIWFSIVGEICWCSFLTILLILNGKIVLVSINWFLFIEIEDFSGDNGIFVVLVGFNDLSKDEELESWIWWWWWVCKWNVNASFFCL